MQPVPYEDLEAALQWVSSSAPFENYAYVSKLTGEVFYVSTTHDVGEEPPEDYEDENLYWSVPHRNDLDLGRALAYQFVEERLPDEFRKVQDIFHRRGAYGRFKDLLDAKNQLEGWYEYERAATESALLAWANEQGLPVKAPTPRTGA